MTSLADALPAEQERVRELLVEYEKIGPSGAFGALLIRQKLKEADAAVMSGDVVRMLSASDTDGVLCQGEFWIDDHMDHYAEAPTAPIAICLCALQAVGLAGGSDNGNV